MRIHLPPGRYSAEQLVGLLRERDARPRLGWWRYRFGVSIVIGGYGLSLGVLARPHYGQPDWLPIRLFRNYAYRGWRAANSQARGDEQ